MPLITVMLALFSAFPMFASLQEALQLDNIAVYNKRATGEKFLIDPSKG